MMWHILLWCLLILMAVLSLLIVLPVGIHVRYRQGELKLWYALGPIRILGYPTKNNKKTNKAPKLNIRTVFGEQIKANRKFDNVLGDFWAELKTALDLFWLLQPRLRIRRLMLKLHLDGKNSASVALQYGGAYAALGSLVPLLEEAFVLKKRELDVDCNFSGGATTLDAEMDITIGLGRLLWCLVRYSSVPPENTDEKHTERRS